jgi:general secretion pathway protein F
VPPAKPDASSLFRYRALTQLGERVSGELAAPDRRSAIAHLQAQGLVPLAAEPAAQNRLGTLLRRDLLASDRLTPRQLAEFIQQLATLIGAGIPAEQALATLSGKDAAQRSRRAAHSLLQSLRTGLGLADAMARMPKIFPPIAIGMVRAGEASGALDRVLMRLGEHLGRSAEIRDAVQSALIYPAILMTTAFGSVLLILTVVLPRLKPMILHARAPLPLSTKIVLGASDLLHDWWWLLPPAGALLILAAWRALKAPGLRAGLDRVALQLPGIGRAVQLAETGRFARSLGALAGANVALPAALALSQAVLTNAVIAGAVERVRGQVKEGGRLAERLAETGVFPDLAIQFIRIGETTGKLDAMLVQQADLSDAELKRLIDRGLTLLVPVITLIMGLVVGGVVASVMTSIMSVNNAAL